MRNRIPSPCEKCPLRGEIQDDMGGAVLATVKEEKEAPIIGILFDKKIRCSRAFTLHPNLVVLKDGPNLEHEQLDLLYQQINNCHGPWMMEESEKVCFAIGEIVVEPEVEATLRDAVMEEFKKSSLKLLTEYSNN